MKVLGLWRSLYDGCWEEDQNKWKQERTNCFTTPSQGSSGYALISCCLQCQNWPREVSLLQTPTLLGVGWRGGKGSLCLAGLSTDTRGIQDNISVFQHATAFVAGLFCLLGERRADKSPESCAARNGLHIYSSLSRLSFFSVFLFHFVSREVDVVDVDLVSVSGDWRWKH